MPEQAPRRGIRELKNLPAASKAFVSKPSAQKKLPPSASVPSGIAAHPTNRTLTSPSDATEDSTMAGAARSVAARAGAVGKQSVARGVELARLYSAIGTDLAASDAPDLAHGFLQRALRAAPPDTALSAEVMGNACVTLNRVGRHAEALAMADAACDVLKRIGPADVQLVCATESCQHTTLPV